MDQESIPVSNSMGDIVKQIDVNQLKDRFMALLQNPAGAQEAAKAESFTVRELYERYVIPLVVAPALCAFIGYHIFPLTIGLGIKMLLVRLIGGLVGFYLGMLLVQTLAPHFGGTSSQPEILKWMIAANFVTAGAGLLSILGFLPLVHYIIPLIQLVAAVYAIYVSWVGMPILLGVTDSRRLPFFLSLIGCGIVIGIIFSALGLLAA